MNRVVIAAVAAAFIAGGAAACGGGHSDAYNAGYQVGHLKATKNFLSLMEQVNGGDDATMCRAIAQGATSGGPVTAPQNLSGQNLQDWVNGCVDALHAQGG